MKKINKSNNDIIYIKNNIPDGYEIDTKLSTFENIVCKRKKSDSNSDITYDNIIKKMRDKYNYCYTINSDGCIDYNLNDEYFENEFISCSIEQCEKIITINMLYNIADVLNDKWKLDWNDITQDKFVIVLNNRVVMIKQINDSLDALMCPVFKSPDLARTAIKIIGEFRIKDAFNQ